MNGLRLGSGNTKKMPDKRLVFPCGAYFPVKDADAQWLESAHRAKDGAYRIGTHPASTPIVDEDLWDKHEWYAPPCSDGKRHAPCLWGCPVPKRRKEERGYDAAGNLAEYVSCFARLNEYRKCTLCWVHRSGTWTHDKDCFACEGTGYRYFDETPPAPDKCPHCEEQRTYVAACRRAAKINEDAPAREKWRKCPSCAQYRELTTDSGLCATCQLVQVVEANRS